MHSSLLSKLKLNILLFIFEFEFVLIFELLLFTVEKEERLLLFEEHFVDIELIDSFDYFVELI